MSIAGKVWGTTELVEANGALEFHRIEMNKGGVCSKHLHEFKWNGFFCESGRLLIRVWQNDYDLVDETILEAGQYTKVKPGLYHQFECLEDGVAFELYWAEFNHNDIKRESVGYSDSSTDSVTVSYDSSSSASLDSITFDNFEVDTTIIGGDADSSFIDPTMDLSNIDIGTDSMITTSTITTITIDDE